MALPNDDWPRLKEVFAGARALPTDKRPAYLATACDGNEALRQEVESLLSSDERAKSFLEAPAVVLGDDTSVARSLEGQRIGPYQIASRIGAGGMGEVYQARDSTLNRQVAIKVLLPAVAGDPDRLARFRREAQVLAGAGQRPDARGSDRKRGDLHQRSARDRVADRGGPRSRARARHHPPGPEACEHQSPRRRHGESAGLRAGQGPRRPEQRRRGRDAVAGTEPACDPDRLHPRDGGVHESRAGAGQSRGPAR